MAKSGPCREEQGTGSAAPDFDAAEHWLKIAREAFETGSDVKMRAALKLIEVALYDPNKGGVGAR